MTEGTKATNSEILINQRQVELMKEMERIQVNYSKDLENLRNKFIGELRKNEYITERQRKKNQENFEKHIDMILATLNGFYFYEKNGYLKVKGKEDSIKEEKDLFLFLISIEHEIKKEVKEILTLFNKMSWQKLKLLITSIETMNNNYMYGKENDFEIGSMERGKNIVAVMALMDEDIREKVKNILKDF